MKVLKLSFSLLIASFLCVYTGNLEARADLSFAEAARMASKLARTSQSEGGLGCRISKVVTVDEGYSSTNRENIRTVLYADCIPCLHIYMFDKKIGNLVFSKSITLADPVAFEQTCVIDRRNALGTR